MTTRKKLEKMAQRRARIARRLAVKAQTRAPVPVYAGQWTRRDFIAANVVAAIEDRQVCLWDIHDGFNRHVEANHLNMPKMGRDGARVFLSRLRSEAVKRGLSLIEAARQVRMLSHYY